MTAILPYKIFPARVFSHIVVRGNRGGAAHCLGLRSFALSVIGSSLSNLFLAAPSRLFQGKKRARLSRLCFGALS